MFIHIKITVVHFHSGPFILKSEWPPLVKIRVIHSGPFIKQSGALWSVHFKIRVVHSSLPLHFILHDVKMSIICSTWLAGPDNTLIRILLPHYCFLTNERKLIITVLIVPGISATKANVQTFLFVVARLSGAEIFIFKTAPIGPGPFS